MTYNVSSGTLSLYTTTIALDELTLEHYWAHLCVVDVTPAFINKPVVFWLFSAVILFQNCLYQ